MLESSAINSILSNQSFIRRSKRESQASNAPVNVDPANDRMVGRIFDVFVGTCWLWPPLVLVELASDYIRCTGGGRERAPLQSCPYQSRRSCRKGGRDHRTHIRVRVARTSRVKKKSRWNPLQFDVSICRSVRASLAGV